MRKHDNDINKKIFCLPEEKYKQNEITEKCDTTQAAVYYILMKK